MIERTLWGAVYALAIFWICTGELWSPYLLVLPLTAILWEFHQMDSLKMPIKLAGFGYTLLAGGATFHLIQLFGANVSFILFSIFILIWISDSMAYIGGRLLGRTPLAPKLSPKKTWEGAIIGALATWGIGLWILLAFHGPTTQLSEPDSWPRYAWLLPAVIAFTAPIGDLIGSKFKRLAQVKDSGYFLPGHGGFLDRFDSFLLSVLVVTLFQSEIFVA